MLGDTVLTESTIGQLLQSLIEIDTTNKLQKIRPSPRYLIAKAQDTHTRREVAKALRAIAHEQKAAPESTTRWRQYVIDGPDFDALMKELEGK